MTSWQHTDNDGFTILIKRDGSTAHVAVAVPGGQAGVWVDVPFAELEDAVSDMGDNMRAAS